MSCTKGFKDLCSTCTYQSNCSLQKCSIRPIWHCNEYVDFAPPSKNNPVKEKVQKNMSIPTHSNEKEDSEKYKGLCVNCDNRENCLRPMPEEGIWHCEEYI